MMGSQLFWPGTLVCYPGLCPRGCECGYQVPLLCKQRVISAVDHSKVTCCQMSEVQIEAYDVR